LTAVFDKEDSGNYEFPVIRVSKVGSDGTRAGTAFTVTFSGVPRQIIVAEYDDNRGEFVYRHADRGYFALGMSVAMNEMVLTPVTGLVSSISFQGAAAKISWSVVTESGVKKYLLEKLGSDGLWHTVADLDPDGSKNYSLDDLEYVAGDEYRITTVDVNGLRQSFAIGSEANRNMFITLDSGWNLISVPLEQADLSVLNELTVGCYWRWDGDSYQALEGAPEALEGVWVYSLVDGFSVKITGVETGKDDLFLQSGWNLKGPRENMYFDNQDLTVFCWTKQSQYTLISEAINQIVSGSAYWIFNPGGDRVIPLQEIPLD
jgi:hypothetical protein